MYLPHWIVRALPLSPSARLEWFPPFRAMGVRVVRLSPDWSQADLLLPLNRCNRNPGGTMFGGAMAALADPIAALACARAFPGHRVWTRAMHLDFVREGHSDLALRFRFPVALRTRIGAELTHRGRATPTFEYAFYDRQERVCAKVTNMVAIRPHDYQPGQPAARERDDEQRTV